MKMCAKCKQILDDAAFYPFRGDKLQSYCIECSKTYDKVYRAREKEKREKERLVTRRKLLMR